MPRRAECRGLNVADAVSRRFCRVNIDGPTQPTPMKETEAFLEGKGVKASLIQDRAVLRDQASARKR